MALPRLIRTLLLVTVLSLSMVAAVGTSPRPASAGCYPQPTAYSPFYRNGYLYSTAEMSCYPAVQGSLTVYLQYRMTGATLAQNSQGGTRTFFSTNSSYYVGNPGNCPAGVRTYAYFNNPPSYMVSAWANPC